MAFSSARSQAAKRAKQAALGCALVVAATGGIAFAQTDSKPAAPVAAKLDKGRNLFANFGCGNCHALADAGATGHVGPALDGNSNLSEAFIVDRVANGQGVMPAFSGQMSPEEIAAIAAYVTQAASK